MEKIDLPLATSTWDQEEIAAMEAVIASQHFTMGSRVQAYEKDFAKLFSSRYAVMCSSGSSANLLMTAALFFRKNNTLKRGDEVIVPAVSWSTTYFPLAQYGLKLRFVDVDRETLNYDLQALEKAFTPQTKLVMAVNLLGNPNDFSVIQRLCRSHNSELIEDNCESMGANVDGRSAGTFGLMGSFSSFFSHHISTMEGGVVVTDDEELYHILLCLRAHGWTRNLPNQNHVTGHKSEDPFEEAYKFVLPGYNVRPLELSGAIGIEQLKKLPSIVKNRRANALTFRELFGSSKDFWIQKEIGQSSWFGFGLVIKPGSQWTRPRLVQRLIALGVECRPIVAGNFAKNPVMKWIDHNISGGLPNAEWVDQNGLFFGNHHYAINDRLERLADALKE